MRLTCAAVVLLIQTLHCLGSDDSPFQLVTKATGFCLVKPSDTCYSIRWTTGDRLLVYLKNKCLGVQGKSVGSEIGLYDCDENNELQKWECINQTVLALKGQDLYMELKADNTAVLSKTIGPKNHLTISGTSSGACSRTFRVLYTIDGNADGKPCMFPFLYKDQWYSDCTMADFSQPWCSVTTRNGDDFWGLCPTNARENWVKDVITGAYYQLNTQAALTWAQAKESCEQQEASLLSITDPQEQGIITTLLTNRGQGSKLWIGLTLNSEQSWQWSNGRPYRYLNWDSGHPISNPEQSCAVVDGSVQYYWQSSQCNQNLSYICYVEAARVLTTKATETGFCSRPWISYGGHCFYLNRTPKKWSEAQKACRKEGGDLVSMRNVEDQSFVISQLGYAPSDELWIGLNDKKKEGLFEWSDHSDVSFTSWESGNPTVSTGTEDCVLIRGEKGNWDDRVCGETHGFICMMTSASEPSEEELEQNIGCKTGWKRHGSYCYFVGTQTKTFDEAKDDCKKSDSYLADVSTGVDNAFLVSLVGSRPEKHFWLGLSNQKNIDDFVWTNTDSVRFTHWNARMPGHQQGCVAMTTGIFAGLWDVLPCMNREKYICKHLAEGAVLTPAPPTVAPVKCAAEWSELKTHNFCYKVFSEASEKRTWYEARDYCKAIGGDLLSIHYHADQYVNTISYSSFWIGLNAPDPLTGYVWSDGSPVNFQHWETGKPNNKNNVESCVEFTPRRWNRQGSWDDVHCEKKNPWICQIRAGVVPKPPPEPITPDYNMTSDGWLEWNGTQYYINKRVSTIDDARHFCQERHGDLVTINSEAESIFLWKQISETYNSFWIGLTVNLDRTVEWMDGSPVVFERWDEGEPDFKNFDENCAAMRTSTGFWHDCNCGLEYRSICKRSASTPANATVSPTVPPKGGCPTNWKKIDSKCYRLFQGQKVTWDEARKQCQSMNGNLASISTRHVQVFLMTEMAATSSTDLWIGLHSLYGSECYWTDGKPKKYINLNSNVFRSLRYGGMDFNEYLRQLYHQRYLERLNKDKCFVINTNPALGIGKWIPKTCNDTNGFICLQDVDPSKPDYPEPTISSDYFKIFNDSMKIVTHQMNWEEAKQHCENEDAHLASLRNEWTQANVELMALQLKSPLWIGLNKNQTNGFFKYIDGWQITFTHWGEKEPRQSQPCVYIDIDGKWKTDSCNQTIYSVCMKSTDVATTDLSDFPGLCPEEPVIANTGQHFPWIPFRGNCYRFLREEKQWPEAAASCVRHGGVLASIQDSFEQEFIKKHIQIFKDSDSSFWLGLYKTHKGDWLWLDRTVMDYTNWGEDQPNDRSYAEISSLDGTWKGNKHWYKKPYICKTPKVLVTPPSPTSTRVLEEPHSRGHIVLAVFVVIAGLAMGIAIAFLLFKKFNNHLPIPDTLSNFANPLFFTNSQSDLADTKKLVDSAEEENPEPLIPNLHDQ